MVVTELLHCKVVAKWAIQFYVAFSRSHLVLSWLEDVCATVAAMLHPLVFVNEWRLSTKQRITIEQSLSYVLARIQAPINGKLCCVGQGDLKKDSQQQS